MYSYSFLNNEISWMYVWEKNKRWGSCFFNATLQVHKFVIQCRYVNCRKGFFTYLNLYISSWMKLWLLSIIFRKIHVGAFLVVLKVWFKLVIQVGVYLIGSSVWELGMGKVLSLNIDPVTRHKNCTILLWKAWI